MLIPSMPEKGHPGQINDTRPWYAETCFYNASRTNQQYTLNLNPVIASVVNYGNYTLLIAGAATTMVFSQGVNSPLADFTSQWAQCVNNFGYFWASIASPGVITLTARTAGQSIPLQAGQGMSAAVITQTVAPFSPPALTAGTLVYWLPTYSADPLSHRQVTTYDVASIQDGFDTYLDVAGVVLRELSNYQQSDSIVGDRVEVLRQGSVWVRNYGTVAIHRSSPVKANLLAGTALLPAGAFGVGADLPQWVSNFQYDSFAYPGETVKLRVLLP
jgi:hypothetical protein